MYPMPPLGLNDMVSELMAGTRSTIARHVAVKRREDKQNRPLKPHRAAST